jgi:membrane-associated phospholipid phosphatase
VIQRVARLPFPDHLATATTYLISPLVLPPVLFGLIVAHFGASAQEIIATSLGALVLLGFVPLAYLGWMVRHHRALSIEVRDRQRRTAPFLVATAAYVAALMLVLLWGDTAKPLVAAILGISVGNAFLLMAITWRWKISIHASSVGGFVSVLWLVAVLWRDVPLPMLHPGWTALLVLLVPLVMWARVRVQAHTKAQVWAGALFGLLVPCAELWLAHRAGLLDVL